MRLLGTGLLLLALLASGCTSEPDADSEPGPGTPAASETAGDGPADENNVENSEEPSGDETGDPLRFSSTESRIVLSCFPDGHRRMIVFDDVRTRRDVTLTDADVGPDADALHVSGAWLSPMPPRAIGESGVLDLDAGGTSMADIDTWADRVRLSGARMEPGTRYMFFVRVDMRPDRSLGDISLGWDDGETTGSSPYDFEGRTRSGGC